MSKKLEPLPTISDYLESVDNSKSVSSKGLEELVYKVRAATGLSYDAAEAIVRLFFQEMRNAILRGDETIISDLGRFYMSSPKITGNKEKVFPKFQPFPKLIKRLNDK